MRDRTLGALNIYSRTPAPFSPEDFSVAELYAGQAGVALANLETHEAAIELAAQLRRALDSRAVIEQAKGMLAERRHMDMNDAFELLRSRARNTNQKLSDVASAVLDGTLGAEALDRRR